MPLIVMAGLDPAIHAFAHPKNDVDARDKRGHDGYPNGRRAPPAGSPALAPYKIPAWLGEPDAMAGLALFV